MKGLSVSVEQMQEVKYLPEEKTRLKGDRLNIILLTFLYVLQGVPIGFSHAIPFILQKRKAVYDDQAEFSLVTYAFCSKLLWSPIVDCIYSKKLGRRKTWLIPTQYFMGICLVFISLNIDDWLGDDSGQNTPNIRILTVTLFLCIFFAATQDIAVDGWSLTMLQRRNIGHSGTCNSIGFHLGLFFGYVLFIILDSKEFCNYFRSVPKDHGFISFADYMLTWAIIFLVTTTVVLLFKEDNSLDVVDDEVELKMNWKESYQHLWEIIKVKPIQKLSLILITCKIAFGPINGVAPLKLLDAGVTGDKVALLSVPLLPLQIILPFILSRYITGAKCMRTFLSFVLYKLFLDVIFAVLIYFTPYFKLIEGDLPSWYYLPLVFFYSLNQLAGFIMGTSLQAFFSRVSDPRYGGMYLTLMNTMSNLGGRWPVTLSLWAVDRLTFQICVSQTCFTVDGFYIEIFLATVIGVTWLVFCTSHIKQLEKLHLSEWTAERKTTVIKTDKLFLASKTNCVC